MHPRRPRLVIAKLQEGAGAVHFPPFVEGLCGGLPAVGPWSVSQVSCELGQLGSSARSREMGGLLNSPSAR